MNYRHAYHAANACDVMKHALLARILVHLGQKPAAFRVIDTHAGIGRYDLAAPEALRTGEWREGFGRLAEPLPGEAEALLAPYRAAVAALRARYGGNAYPGSPLIALALMRPQDRAIFVEKHPVDIGHLREALERDRRAKAVSLDGWIALNAMIPPPERRGVVLVDPPFEETGEHVRLGEALAAAAAKWPTGIFAGWYPIKDTAPADALAERIARIGRPALRLELVTDADAGPARLGGCGLVVINPPWKLSEEADVLLPALAQRLASGERAGWRVDALGPAR